VPELRIVDDAIVWALTTRKENYRVPAAA